MDLDRLSLAELVDLQTPEAREAAHRYVDGMNLAPNCGWGGPCGDCNVCMHMRVSHAFKDVPPNPK